MGRARARAAVWAAVADLIADGLPEPAIVAACGTAAAVHVRRLGATRAEAGAAKDQAEAWARRAYADLRPKGGRPCPN